MGSLNCDAAVLWKRSLIKFECLNKHNIFWDWCCFSVYLNAFPLQEKLLNNNGTINYFINHKACVPFLEMHLLPLRVGDERIAQTCSYLKSISKHFCLFVFVFCISKKGKKLNINFHISFPQYYFLQWQDCILEEKT